MRIGVDVGGTFTDIITVQDGEIDVTKTPSTPDAPEEGVLEGLEKLTDTSNTREFNHGTTVATNAVLERDWATTALITNEGFRDVLEIGRQDRPSLYDFDAEKPRPVVERHRRYEVGGRLDKRGNELERLGDVGDI
ncbi:MAG: hydantoinase/oxoprolinase N-terminal domain-containing protein, partial [Halobacteria archaeon]|nr:hydantoinase/oxoprolinase N-terminal domain-containing protein [Halobacteria archaeon]